MEILRTVVGSFPVKNIPVEKAIVEIVEMQLKYGINVVSDGEQRADMIGYFENIPGLERNQRGLYIKSKILPPQDVSKFTKFIDAETVKRYLDEKGRHDVSLKVTITGPITLGFSTAVNGLNYYSSLRDTNIYVDFANALSPFVKEICRKGYYLQIDEPSLSAKVIDTKIGVNILNDLLKNLPSTFKDEKTIVHVCGQLNSRIFNDLLNVDAKVLSLAFSAPNVQKNIDLLNKQILYDAGKRIGVGCISVQVSGLENVDSVEAVLKRLLHIKEKIGVDYFAFVHPDCGLRALNEKIAETILERMYHAVNMFL
ncbi:MAG: hypothetical protein N3F64_06120 [Nitrososphaeria archaeon]|nr:hypothetical protein [Nitrososphaeria archaeon]